jgi:hypothetical protein
MPDIIGRQLHGRYDLLVEKGLGLIWACKKGNIVKPFLESLAQQSIQIVEFDPFLMAGHRTDESQFVGNQLQAII